MTNAPTTGPPLSSPLPPLGESNGTVGKIVIRICVAAGAIAALSILAVILQPVLRSGRAAAKTGVSKSNLLQIGLAARMYCLENRNVLPPADTWPEAIVPYLGGDLSTRETLRSPHDPDAGRAYAMNAQLAGMEIDDVDDKAVLFFEAEFGSPPAGGPELLPAKPRGPDGYVIAFADGHVLTVPKDEIGQLIWTLDDQ